MTRLVIAPHADDEVLGCGGTIVKYAKAMHVAVVAEMDSDRYEEFGIARGALGYQQWWTLGFPDTEIGAHPARLVGALDDVLRQVKPDVVYLPTPSMHQDHVAVYEAGMRACRPSMSSTHWWVPEVLVYDVAAYDVAMYPTDLRWNVFETLERWMVERKAHAMAAYGSQVEPGAPGPGEAIPAMAAAIGAPRKVAYAEQFALVRSVR